MSIIFIITWNTEANVVFVSQLYPHLHAARRRNGHLLRPRRAIASRNTQTVPAFPLRESYRRKTGLWPENRVYVGPSVYTSQDPQSSFVAQIRNSSVHRCASAYVESDCRGRHREESGCHDA